MTETGHAKLVSIYVSEDDRLRGRPAYMAILEFLRARGARSATVIRSIAGFDDDRQIHSAGVVALSTSLTVKIEWIDSPARVDALLPEVEQLVEDGLIATQDITVVKWTSVARKEVLRLPVSTIMNEDVASVEIGTRLADVVALLLRKGYRSVPVVEADGRVVGTVTDGDLLRNTSLPVRLGLHPTLTQDQVQSDIAELQAEGRTVDEIMTMPVVTVTETMSVRQAGALMVQQDLKRLPVVDAQGALVGIVSRVDILRALSKQESEPRPRKGTLPPSGDVSISGLMNREAPYVTADADLEEVMRALEVGRQQRLVVVDDTRHAIGMITDGDLMRRSMYGRSPSLRRRLRNLITGASPAPLDLPTGKEHASELMTSPVISVAEDASLSEALELMLEHSLKRLPVTDADGKLEGVLGRTSVLRGLMAE